MAARSTVNVRILITRLPNVPPLSSGRISKR
jgi:hypothetical protein